MKNKKDEKNIKNDENETSETELNQTLDNSNENQLSSEESTEKLEDNENKEDELLEEINILKEEKIRLLAEMENLRKRFERDKVDAIKFGSTNLARDMLSLGDNLERALEAIPKNEQNSTSIKNLIEGLQMVLKEFSSILEKNSVKKIESINQKFDHNLHQAMMEIETTDSDEGIVIQEIQPGYTIHDRLLRPAMVGVSKKPDSIDGKKTNEDNQDKKEK